MLSSGLIVAACGALLAAAFAAEGYRTPKLELHDAGVWLSREADDEGHDNTAAVGRSNTQISEVDVKVDLAGSAELFQADETVLVRVGSVLCAIDGRTAAVRAQAALPEDARVVLGGTGDATAAAVLDPRTGGLWVANGGNIVDALPPADTTCAKEAASKADEVGGETTAEGTPAEATEEGDGEVPAAEPTTTVEGGTYLVVGTDGIAWVYDPDSGALRGVDATGAPAGEARIEIPDDHDLHLTVVGETPVVLDEADKVLRFPDGGTTELDEADYGTGARLQEPGPARDVVLVATDRGLYEVPLGGGAPRALTDEGDVAGAPAAPLHLLGCSYGAWAGRTESVVATRCVNSDDTKVQALPGDPPATGPFTFRTNRGRVMVNDLHNGTGYLVGDDEVTKSLWRMANLEPDTSDEEQDSDTLTEQDEEPAPPVAVPDTDAKEGEESFATRPGRAVVVHPMRNDYDLNGDVIVIQDNLEDLSGCECLSVVDGGMAVQVTPPEGSLEGIRFRYTISDGTGQPEASAEALVRIVPEGQNEPPEVKDQHTYVNSNGTVRHNVLAEATDPDGDALGLVLPVTAQPDATLTATADGLITFTAPGGSAEEPFVGTIEVPFTVTDGQATNATTEAKLVIDVRDPRVNHDPTARGDHAVTVANHEVVVDVLANDSDPDGDPLRVTQPGTSTDAEIRVDEVGKLHVTPRLEGPLVFTYSITDGRSSEQQATVRVDVLAPTTNTAPVAVRDDIVLPPVTVGSPETPVGMVDALANDFDADGDVLVVAGVNVPAASGLVVEVLDHRFLRARSARALEAPVQFTYTVTDGTQTDSTTVVVRPGSVARNQPPNAADDAFAVRAGEVAALDVLRNDTDPEGAPIAIDPALVTGADRVSKDDRVFVQDGKLRFQAPSKVPDQPVTLHYTPVDPSGSYGNTATVTVTILGIDDPNRAPVPVDLTARTLSGQDVVIPIPVSTMDPDGDDVTLLGLDDAEGSAPLHGSIAAIGTESLTYRPDTYAAGFYGTDTFRYSVRDRHGVRASGTIRVGVAAPPTENHPPAAVDDLRQSGPEGLTFDVVRNDSDPDGDHLRLVDADGFLPEPTAANASWAVEVDNGQVHFDPKGFPTGQAATFTYWVSDGVLRSQGRATVTMTDDLEPVPPLAMDDRGPATVTGDEVEIDVLANDIDPDGLRADLEIIDITSIEGLDDASLPPFENPVRFTMPANDVVLRYTVVDPDEGEARAVIRVRHADPEKQYPPSAPFYEATTTGTSSVSIAVLEQAVVTPGREAVLLGATPRKGGTCTAQGDEVVFTADAGFSGLSGCSYVIGDGAGDAADTMKATGTISVTVKAEGNTPPRFVPQRFSIFSDKREVTYDLRAAVVDVDDPEQQNGVCLGQPEGAVEGLSARIEGTVLHLQADAGTSQAAPHQTLTLSVSDCDGGEADPLGTVYVEVGDYEGPLAVLGNDAPQTTEGEPVEFNVLENDSPMPLGDELTVVRVDGAELGGGEIAVGGGKARLTIEPSGRAVFTPNPEVGGEPITFTYTVDDGTGNPVRYQTATVAVMVIGFPDPPSRPNVVSGDGQVTLTWGVPADRGAPIIGYRIRINGSTVESVPPVSSFMVTGLTNGQPYTFEVAAWNEANEKSTLSATERWSDSSPQVIPNRFPDQPAAPVAKFVQTGGAIDVSWAPLVDDQYGSIDYTLSVSPPTIGGGSSFEHLTEPSWPVTDLENGTKYTFTVTAIGYTTDDLGQHSYASPPSPPSAPEIPAKPPDAPTKPTINPSDLGDNNITVHWVAPNDNGDAIATYHVEYFTGGGSQGVQQVPGDTLQTTVYNTDNNKKYTFTVTAENKAGPGAASPPSDEVNSSGAPAAPGAVTASEGDTTSTLTFAAPSGNGAPIDGYQYRTAAPSIGAWIDRADTDPGPGVALVATGLANDGTTYQFQVRARNTSPAGQVRWSPESPASNSVRPYGNPGKPSINYASQGLTTLTWTWTSAVPNGHDSLTYQVRTSTDGSNWSGAVGANNGAGANSHTIGSGVGQPCQYLQVRGIGNRSGDGREIGEWSDAARSCPPQPTVSISVGTSSTGACWAYGDLQGCYNVRIEMNGFTAGPHTVRCYSTMNTNTWQLYAEFSAGNGVHQECSYSMAGRWVAVVVDGTISGSTWPDANGCGFANSNHTGVYSGCSAQWPTN